MSATKLPTAACTSETMPAPHASCLAILGACNEVHGRKASVCDIIDARAGWDWSNDKNDRGDQTDDFDALSEKAPCCCKIGLGSVAPRC